MLITRNQLRQIIQEETRRLNEQSAPDAKRRAADALNRTGKFFYDATQDVRDQWQGKGAVLQDLKALQQNLPDLIAYIEGLEGDTWDEILGTWWWGKSNR